MDLNAEKTISSVLLYTELWQFVCSPSKLPQVMNSIRSILCSNGYLDNLINSKIKRKIEEFKLPPKEEPEKSPVYFKLPWIGNISTKFEEQCKTAVSSSFGAVKLHVVFPQERCFQRSAKMSCLPSNKVWSFINTCVAVIVGTQAAHLKDCKIE